MAPSRHGRDVAAFIAVVAAYFVAGKLGLRLAFVHESATAIWPPTGIALAALLLLGRRVAPAVFLGAFLVNETTAGSVATSLALAAGNTLEALLGAALVERYAGGRKAFDRPQDVFRFAALAGLLSTTASATIGVTSLSLGGYAEWTRWGSIWLTWWLGDVGGDLIVAPVLVLWAVSARPAWTRREATELPLLLFALALVGLGVFGGWSPFADKTYPLEFLPFPILVWAAFRFGPRETATATLVLSGIATWGTLRGFGPFARDVPTVSLLLLQACLGVMAVMALALAAAVLEEQRLAEEARAAEERLRLAERRQAEEALRMGEERLAEAQALAHVGSWTWRVASDTVVWSDEVYRIFGLEPGSTRVTYQSFLAAVHAEDRSATEQAIGRSLETGDAFAIDHRIVRPDGAVRWLHSRGRVETGGGGALRMFGTAQDTTERQRVERAKSQFIANAAHELRTPLTTIVGLADVLAAFRRKLTEEQLDEYCEMIQRQGDRARLLITGLLDLSRLDQGMLPLEPRSVPLASAARNAVEAAAPPEGVSVRVQVPDTLHVVADPMRLEQILVNLLTNAYRYGGRSVELTARDSESEVRIAVSDDGPGVPEDLVPFLFEPFMRSKEHQRTEGTGLGLAISRGLVQALGGDIAYEAAHPAGARFVVRLRKGS